MGFELTIPLFELPKIFRGAYLIGRNYVNIILICVQSMLLFGLGYISSLVFERQLLKHHTVLGLHASTCYFTLEQHLLSLRKGGHNFKTFSNIWAIRL
jgi:hypothetical protein